MTVIDLQNASLRFNLNAAGRVPLKDRFLQLCSGNRTPRRHVDAVKNMNLQIRAGERIGLIGGNGAGKSSLLRLLAGIYRPTTGSLRVDGKIDSMLDLGIGIEPEATGWKNIEFRCYLRGETPKQMRAKREQIGEFSELGDHLNTLVRFYSTGMTVRLLFALATAIDPDVLLVDEVLSAGDLGFVEKARRRMIDLIEKARVLVCASHDLGSLSELCTRALWIRQGEIVADAKPDEVIREYKAHMSRPTVVQMPATDALQAARAA